MKHILCSAAMFAAMVASAAAFDATVWRGEMAYVEIPEALRDKVSCLYERWTGDDMTLTLLRFDEVEYDLVEKYTDGDGKTKARIPGKGRVRDVCREWKSGDKDLPSMIKIAVKPDAKPFNRLIELDRTGEEANFLNVKIVDRVLPPAKDWKYFLDLWQHPWAVSRYFGVEPFSTEHYAKMEPIWRALAESGCKALTVTLLDLPWNNQCYDAYHSMIGRVKKADGSWVFDYGLFDEYVEFGRKCGLGPDIACYTMCPWGYMVSWKEEETGNGEQGMGNGLVDRREKYLPGTPEFEGYWGDFLVDFEKHLKAKGWFEDAYIAMDERAPEDVRKIIDLIHKKSPGMKVAMAGNKSPSEFSGMKIDNYCQGLIHLRKHPQMLDDLEPRRRNGCKTTFYVCCTAAHPNTFMDSPLDEAFWLGAYPVMIGFDGFLRWAANSWPEDPYKDASFKTVNRDVLQWRPGDTFFVYPGGEPSARLIALRAGVVAAEKMRLLREQGAKNGENAADAIKRLAEPYGYKSAVRGEIDFGAFRRGVEAFVNADGEPATEAGETLRVMTYNIRNSEKDATSPDNNWNARKADFADLVERENPDIAGFQEVLPDQMAFLKERFPAYAFVGEFRNQDRTSGEASPVAFRKDRFSAVDCGTFWLSETPDEPGSKSWNAAYPRICSYAVLVDNRTGKKFCFANTHTDHISEEAREKGMLLTVERMKSFGNDSPIILTGDLNCLENEKPALAVSGLLKDALYASETTPEGTWRTFNGWLWHDTELTIADAFKLDVASRSATGGKRIDYIYVSPGIRVQSFRTNPEPRPGGKSYPSDHFPTVAEIRL